MRLCDFCDAPNPLWQYTVAGASGAFVLYTCQLCSDLIEAGDKAALAARHHAVCPVPVNPTARGVPPVKAFMDLHEHYFWVAYYGVRQPVK